MSIKKQRLKAYALVLAFLVGHFHGTDCHQLFDAGKEYQYSYLGLFTTGTEEYPTLPGYSSSWALLGTLRVQGNDGNSFTAKLENMKMAMYNGRWSYFPVPQFGFFEDPRLSSLEEPFKVVLTEEGKFKTLIMNDQEPEYASNLKRGLATYLQLNMTSGFNSMQIFKESELTTMGECPTAYEVIPESTSPSFVKIGKFRNHADCPDVPRRTRHGIKSYYYSCASDKTRDFLNSTSYATYDIALDGSSNPTMNKVTIFSSILYWPFTSQKQFLYTWFNVTLALINAVPIISPISGPENAENHEDLSFVFEQSDYQDPEEETPDVKTVEPFYFHQTLADNEDPEIMKVLMEKAKEAISQVGESLNRNIDLLQEDFHSNSPTKISHALSYLDNSSLKLLFTQYSTQSYESEEKKSHLELFLDGLVLAGTSASTIVIRDLIVEKIEDWKILSRILPLFPYYIQTPSEALAKEFDTVFDLLNSSKLSPTMKRRLEFSLATLVSRCCERNECATSGLLDKYVNYFENNFNSATNFDAQTAAVLGLRNLQIGKSLEKVFAIAVGNISTSSIVRVQAIWSLRPLFFRDPETTMRTLLQVFYNRTESCEIRTSIFGLIMSVQPEKRVLHEIAYYMWSETCPQTLNIVRSTLTHLSKATGPCTKMSSYARTILKYLPPGSVDPTRTTSYAIEYFDESNGFGKGFYATVQKSGKTALPVSIFMGTSHTIGGYSSSPIGIFIRLQGLEKFISGHIVYSSDEDGADKILKVLSDLKVKLTENPPLQLELTVVYLDRVIYHKGIGKSLFGSVRTVMQEIQTMTSELQTGSKNFLWGPSIPIAETLYQQPLEVGIPVSIYTSGIMSNRLQAKLSLVPGTKTSAMDFDVMYKSNFFATTTISNHVPIFNTRHTAGLLRTLRIQQPRHIALQFKQKSDTINYSMFPPPADNPFAIQTHATAFTSISNDSPLAESADELLSKSCPNCKNFTLVSSGPVFSETAEVVSIPVPNGLSSGVKKFMCEKHISKSRLLQKVQDFFGSKGKNTGIFDTNYAKGILSFHQLLDYFFYWPNAEPCGFQVYFRKNVANSSYALQKVEGSLSFEVPASVLKGEIQLKETLKLFYDGLSPPPTKTVTTHFKITKEKVDSQQVHLKFSIDGQPNGETLIGCVDLLNYMNPAETDPLGFEGENEPKVNQSLKVKVGKVAGSVVIGDTTQCPTDQLDISITGTAERSQEQIAEAQGQSRDFSYILCKLERESGHWPKALLPPTRECFEVLLDQTALRKVNLSIQYKVGEEVGKRLRGPLLFIGNVLSPFLVDPDQDKVHLEHSHVHDEDGGGGLIEIDINLKKLDPVMDIHFIGGSNQERHYHDVDFDLIPNALKLQPAPGRFAPSTQFFYKAGFIGTCAFTPSYLVTFDNLKYAAKFRDCETLVVADCKENLNFAVYARVIASKLSIRFALLGDEINISEGKITSKGNDIKFDSNGEFFRDGVTFYKKGAEITIKSIIFGIELRFSGGDLVQISLGSRYRGDTTCGLCGNFDTTSTNDMQGPTSPSCSLSSMVDAWTLKSGTCEQLASVC